MAPKIYTASIPPVSIPNHSIFTHLFDNTTYPGSAPAFIDASSATTLSRGQLKQLALCLGYALRTHPNLATKRGDTVLIYSQNSLVWPVVIFGSVAAGLRCTLANNAYSATELAFQYQDSEAKIVFSSEDGVATVFEMFKQLGLSKSEAERRIVLMPNGLQWAGGPAIAVKPELAGLLQVPDLLTLGALKEEEKFEGSQVNETVYLCYSSGTTGKPKGVETTHKNMVSVLEMVAKIYPKLTLGVDAMLGILPFYHIYGAVNLLHFPFLHGIPVAIMARFDPVQFCANIERYKITNTLIVPPVLVVLNRHPAVDQYDMSTLEVLLSGAAPLGAALTKQVTERLLSKRKGNKPLYVIQGYGLTETSPTTHMLQTPYAISKIGSIGTLLPNLEARLVVDGDGDGNIDAEQGQPGELWVRGPSVMKGYLNNVAATKDAITTDMWFKTGDIAIRDAEGFYYIVDRRKELIKYKGFQVPPAELESVLLTHPEVADAAVIGVDSIKEATELPRAYVVAAYPENVKTDSQKAAFAESVKKWIQQKVARHKHIRGGVVIIDAVPKSAAGKILRRELRDRAKEELKGIDPSDCVKAKL
ncbi:hypothetical protein K443DRAFT_671694 [Laccaria amethystina LaAM-08-1]|uniref:4-coumarate--CoA ligase n=1 Tax=Laccaria amethystina LaAM-08-1 TaxID=1095629 RepID=A0A0C9XVY3_9AGAR|nr:hypothetical protein K443DRAFT_671694 [Laccaria amethystina LaAM-08-1]